ncbi:MAG: hypothetical protein KGL39_13780 [Patescibacteria group bacterium]|nr:hypothetical protein [Patescibacteria group bacterium]
MTETTKQCGRCDRCDGAVGAVTFHYGSLVIEYALCKVCAASIQCMLQAKPRSAGTSALRYLRELVTFYERQSPVESFVMLHLLKEVEQKMNNELSQRGSAGNVSVPVEELRKLLDQGPMCASLHCEVSFGRLCPVCYQCISGLDANKNRVPYKKHDDGCWLNNAIVAAEFGV